MGILDWLWTLVVLTTVHIVSAQVGLRTSPLTAPKIRHHNEYTNNNNRTGMGVFSKWPSLEMGHRRGGSGKIESELAAIFRGVAYGVSTLPPTTAIPTTTSSTTTEPVVDRTKYIPILPNHSYENQKPNKDNQAEPRNSPISPTNFPDWREAELQPKINQVPSQKPSIQYPYAEYPEINTGHISDHKSKPKSGITDVQVVRAEGTEVEWIQSLGVTWYIHVYSAAGLYSILAFLAIIWFIRAKTYIYLLSTGYYIIIQVLMFVATILRSVHLFHDPYGAEQKLPQPLSKVVEETAWPCLTAAIAVVVVAIVRSWQCPRIVPQHYYIPLGLALITTVHLLITLTSLLTAYLVPGQALALDAASRTVTLAWGTTVGLCGLFATWKVGRVYQKHSAHLSLQHENSQLQSSPHYYNSRTVLIHGTNLVLVICLAQISLAGLHLYALVGPHYLLDIPPTYPWFWMVYQSTVRILEIISWILLCATSALKLATSTNKHPDSSGERKLMTILGCQCCGPLTSISTEENFDEDLYADMCQTSRSAKNFTLLHYVKDGYQETLAHPLMGKEKPFIKINQNMSLNKSLALQENKIDSHIYCNSNNEPNTSLTQSSMLSNDSGFMKFEMNAEQSQVVDEVLRKSLKNLDLVSQIHDLKIQKLKSSQNKLNPNDYSNDSPPYQHNSASSQKAHNQGFGLLQSQGSGNLDVLLKNQLNNKKSLSNPTSPQPQSDIDVNHYYQNPSSASYHTYASLQRPSSHSYQPQNTSYRFEKDSRVVSSPKKESMNNLSPTYMSPTDNPQNMNLSSSNSASVHKFKKSVSLSPSPKRSPHFNLRHGTPDSGLSMDFYGYTDNISGDDISINSNNAQIKSRLYFPNHEEHQSHIVVTQNYRGGVKSTDLSNSSRNHTRHSQQRATRSQKSPMINHTNPNSDQTQSPLLSPSRPPFHPGSPNSQERQRLQLQQQLQQRIQDEKLRQQRENELVIHNQSEKNKSLRKYSSEANQHQSSPLLIRLSSNGSNSDSPSEYQNSEDEIRYNQNTTLESEYENASEPEFTEGWPPPANLIKN